MTLNGLPVLRANLRMPRVGIWHAHVHVLSQAAPAGPVTLATTPGLSLQGTAAGKVVEDVAQALVVGGSGAFATAVPSAYYEGAPARLVLGDILTAAGETLSPSSDAAVLGASLDRWTTFAAPAGTALERLLFTLGASWRVLPDGSVWVGTDTFPPPPSLPIYTLLDEAGAQRRATLAVEDAWLLPGTTFLGRQVSYVVHTVTPERARTEVLFEG